MFLERSRILCGALRDRVGQHVEVDYRARGRDHWIIWKAVPFESRLLASLIPYLDSLKAPGIDL